MNILAYFFIFAAIILRVLRHFDYIDLPPNFAPIAAIALFSGVYLSKKQAILVPLIAMFISDALIGFYNPKIMFSVYLSFFLTTLIGFYIRQHKNFYNIFAGSLSGSIIFFLVTNFAVWAFAKMYPANFAGLIQCYLMAIPFFKYTLLGDIFYVTVLFGIYETIRYFIRQRRALWETSNN